MWESVLDINVHVASIVDVACGGISGSIDWQLLEVVSNSMELSVIVPVESSLEESIRRVPNSWNHSCRRECNLLDFCEVVDGVLVQFDDSDLDHWELIVFPDFGAIEGKWDFVSIVFFHDLYSKFVSREIPTIDGLSKISSQKGSVLASN